MATRTSTNRDQDEQLAKLVYMGFDIAQSRIALIKNGGDLERAMEFLLVDDAATDVVHPPDEDNTANVSLEEDEEGEQDGLPCDIKIQAEEDSSVSGGREIIEGSKQTEHTGTADYSVTRSKLDPPADLELVSAGNGPVPLEFATTPIRNGGEKHLKNIVKTPTSTKGALHASNVTPIYNGSTETSETTSVECFTVSQANGTVRSSTGTSTASTSLASTGQHLSSQSRPSPTNNIDVSAPLARGQLDPPSEVRTPTYYSVEATLVPDVESNETLSLYDAVPIAEERLSHITQGRLDTISEDGNNESEPANESPTQQQNNGLDASEQRNAPCWRKYWKVLIAAAFIALIAVTTGLATTLASNEDEGIGVDVKSLRNEVIPTPTLSRSSPPFASSSPRDELQLEMTSIKKTYNPTPSPDLGELQFTATRPTNPSKNPLAQPTIYHSMQPSHTPSIQSSVDPSKAPSMYPSTKPTTKPSQQPSLEPSTYPSDFPSSFPTQYPSDSPTKSPSDAPSKFHTIAPTDFPTRRPTEDPSMSPTRRPTWHPTLWPTRRPTRRPTWRPTWARIENPTRKPVGWNNNWDW